MLLLPVVQVESLCDRILHFFEKYDKGNGPRLYARQKKTRRTIPTITTNAPRVKIAMMASLRWTGICNRQTLYIGNKRIRPKSDVMHPVRFHTTSVCKPRRDSPSVITSVISAAAKNVTSSMQVCLLIGFHSEEIGRQATEGLSTITVRDRKTHTECCELYRNCPSNCNPN